MPVDRQLADKVVAFLNELLAIDPDAVTAMCKTRFTCNRAFADHPTVQVHAETRDVGPYSVGLLGILNGLVGAYDDGERKAWGAIAATYDDGNPAGVPFDMEKARVVRFSLRR